MSAAETMILSPTDSISIGGEVVINPALAHFLAVLECPTDEPWDRLWQDLADACTESGSEVRLNTPVSRVVIEDNIVKGVEIPRAPNIMLGEAFQVDLTETDCVISTLPVWNVKKRGAIRISG